MPASRDLPESQTAPAIPATPETAPASPPPAPPEPVVAPPIFAAPPKEAGAKEAGAKQTKEKKKNKKKDGKGSSAKSGNDGAKKKAKAKPQDPGAEGEPGDDPQPAGIGGATPTPSEPPGGQAPEVGKRLRWLPFVAASLGVALLAAAVVVAVVQRGHIDDLTAQKRDRQRAEQLAAQFSQELSTVDTSDPEASLARLRALATPAYAKDLTAKPLQGGAAGSKPGAEQVRLRGEVRETYLTEISSGSASALCEVAMSLTAPGVPPEGLSRTLLLKIDLQRVHGSWKVSSSFVVPSTATGGTGLGSRAPATSKPATSSTPPSTGPH